MCAIFGLLDYGGRLTPKERLDIVRALGKAAEVRGADASGIAYVQNGAIHIQKAPRPARRMRWRIDPQARYIMGHTRMTTQGSEIKNYNNHPFSGRAGRTPFALAHNGVLFNDRELQRSRKLPPAKIETDSYVIVQLIERAGTLTARTLQQAAEALEGSFTFSVLDSQDNLYLVKGNNPLTLYRFPSLEIYLYASTREILDQAMAALGMEKVRKEDIPLSQGDILRIDRLGQRTLTRFNDTRLCLRDYYRYGDLWDYGIPTKDEGMDTYLEEVVNYGVSQGIPERELRLLVEAGYDAFDLEELLSDPFLRRSCVQEILCDIWA